VGNGITALKTPTRPRGTVRIVPAHGWRPPANGFRDAPTVRPDERATSHARNGGAHLLSRTLSGPRAVTETTSPGGPASAAAGPTVTRHPPRAALASPGPRAAGAECVCPEVIGDIRCGVPPHVVKQRVLAQMASGSATSRGTA